MKHVVTTIVPDCPMCGKEMHVVGRMAGVDDKGNRVGYRLRQHWECPGCGHAYPEETGRINLNSTEVTFPVEDAEIEEPDIRGSGKNDLNSTEVTFPVEDAVTSDDEV